VDSTFIKQNEISQESKRFKHHMMMLFRIKSAGEKIPALNNKKNIELYCTKLLENLWDREKALQIFKIIEQDIQQSISETKLPNHKLHMLRAFTEELQPSIRFKKTEGILTYYNDEQGYGFIRIMHTKDDVFVHVSEMLKTIGDKVEVNDRIRFHVTETYKGRQAKNLELVR